jgi:hypothetical protein
MTQSINRRIAGNFSKNDGAPEALRGVKSVSSGTTLTTDDLGFVVQCSGTSADYNVILPAADSCTNKQVYLQMKDSDAGLTRLVTVMSADSTSTKIDGEGRRVMHGGETAVLFSDGTNWTKIGGKTDPLYAFQYGTGLSDQSVATATQTKITLGKEPSATYFSGGDVGTKNTNLRTMQDYANSQIVIKRDGVYEVQACVRINNLTSSSNIEVGFGINAGGSHNSGSAVGFSSIRSGYHTTSDYPAIQMRTNSYFKAGDTLILNTRHYKGSNQNYLLNNNMTHLEVKEKPSW